MKLEQLLRATHEVKKKINILILSCLVSSSSIVALLLSVDSLISLRLLLLFALLLLIVDRA
jgi:hypothetical protein